MSQKVSKFLTEEVNNFQELMEGVELESCSPLFLDEAIIVPSEKEIRRLNKRGKRFYYTQDKKGDLHFMMSVTSALSHGLPASDEKYLNIWKEQQAEEIGIAAREAYVMERIAYGTAMHILATEVLYTRKIDKETCDETFMAYLLKFYDDPEKAEEIFNKYKHQLKKAIWSLATWIVEYDVVPIACEYPLADIDWRVGGMTDLICTMNAKKYAYPTQEKFEKLSKKKQEEFDNNVIKWRTAELRGRERIVAVVDFKSGSNAATAEKSAIQAEIYRTLFNKEMEERGIDVRADIAGVWAPKDWRTSPSYTFVFRQDEDYFWKIQNVRNAVDHFQFDSIGHVIDFVRPIELDKPEDIWKSYDRINLVERLKEEANKNGEDTSKDKSK